VSISFLNIFTDNFYNLSLGFTTSLYHILRVNQEYFVIVRVVVSRTNIVGFHQVGLRLSQFFPCPGNQLLFRYVGFSLETDENSLEDLFDVIYDLWGSGEFDGSALVALNLRV